ASRDRVLSDAELLKVWRGGEQLGWPFGPITQLLILTGQRRNEVAGARWAEFDLEKRLWAIPRERRKGSVSQNVPLPEKALEILTELPRFGSDYVFPAQRGGRGGHVSGYSVAKRRLDQLSSVTGWRLHDLRRTIATGLQALGARLEVIEEVLGHASGS